MKKVNEFLRLARLARTDAERAAAASHEDSLNAIAREWQMLADERRKLLELRAHHGTIELAAQLRSSFATSKGALCESIGAPRR